MSLDLENLGEIDAERLGDQSTAFLQDRLQIVMIEHELAEIGERELASNIRRDEPFRSLPSSTTVEELGCRPVKGDRTDQPRLKAFQGAALRAARPVRGRS